MPLKKKVKKKPASSGLSRKYDTKHVGHEMEFGNIDFNTIANAERNILLHQALAWYAYMYDIKKDFKEPVKSYLLGLGWSKSDVSALNHVRWEFESAGAMKLIRMTQMGWQLNERESTKVDAFVNRLKGMAQEYRAAAKTPTVEATRVKKFDDQDQLMYDLEYEFEDAIMNKEIPEFNVYDRIKSLGTARKILVHYVQPWIQGRIAEAQTAEFKEQYGVRFRNKVVKAYEAMLADVERALVVPKRAPRARVKKSTPAVKQVRNLKYLKDSAEYKVTSINPEKIVGAKSILVFNTKYRKLIWYTSSSSFEVSGSTLKNVSKGEGKTLRKPEEQLLPFIKTNAQTKLLKAFADINSKPSDQSPRLNDQCVILKAIS